MLIQYSGRWLNVPVKIPIYQSLDRLRGGIKGDGTIHEFRSGEFDDCFLQIPGSNMLPVGNGGQTEPGRYVETRSGHACQ